MFCDTARSRVYVIGGEGFVDVFEQADADHYNRVARYPTASGARTGYFVPDWGKLFVAVPHWGGQRAEVVTFDVR